MKLIVASAFTILFLECLVLTTGCNDGSAPIPDVPEVPAASIGVSSHESGSALSPPVDESLTLDDYISRSLPSHDRTWSGDDMRRATEALTEIAKHSAANLPRYESARSGDAFARLVADDNLDLSRDRSIPIDQRMRNASQLMHSTNQLLKLYMAAFTPRAVGGDELVEIMGSQLRISTVVFQLVNEQLPTLDKNESTYPVRMQGLKQMRNGTASIIFGCLQTLTESQTYRMSERKRLTEHLQKVFPQIVPELSPENYSELLIRVRDLAADSEMGQLSSELKRLLVEAEASPPPSAPPLTDSQTNRPHAVNFNEVAAGTLRNDGWVRAVSKSAGFSVLLPGKYNDFNQSTVTENGNDLKTHHLGMKTSDGVTYSVMALEGGDEKTASEFLASLSKVARGDDSVHSRKDIELAGTPGVEHSVQNAESGAVVRGYVFKDLSYVLMAEYPSDLARTVSVNVQKFLDSFEPR